MCSCFGRACKWFPVLIFTSIVIWTYYAYVVQLTIFTVTNDPERVIYLVFYHILLIMFCWSYCKTVFTDVGRVPAEFKPPEEIVSANNEERELLLKNFANNLPINNISDSGLIRYCVKCNHLKPDRTHHCSKCGTCVLKMDHHCQFLNSCISFYNYKFFVLLLGYSSLYCTYIACTSLQYAIMFWKDQLESTGRHHIEILFCISLILDIILVLFFIRHCYLIVQNKTTIETSFPPKFRESACFSLSRYKNFKEVFGNNPITWFLPVFTSIGDGVEFPLRQINNENQRLLNV